MNIKEILEKYGLLPDFITADKVIQEITDLLLIEIEKKRGKKSLYDPYSEMTYSGREINRRMNEGYEIALSDIEDIIKEMGEK